MRHWVAQLVRRVVWQLVRKAMTGEQLRQAVRRGDAAKVSTLLSTQGAQSFINYQDEAGNTPLHYATGFGHAAVTKQLIAARCNVHLQEDDGLTVLHGAAYNWHEAATEKLLAARCNVNLQSKNGVTPLFFSAERGHATLRRC